VTGIVVRCYLENFLRGRARINAKVVEKNKIYGDMRPRVQPFGLADAMGCVRPLVRIVAHAEKQAAARLQIHSTRFETRFFFFFPPTPR
jgi:hypothetical protein